jgi:hypothetical protein
MRNFYIKLSAVFPILIVAIILFMASAGGCTALGQPGYITPDEAALNYTLNPDKTGDPETLFFDYEKIDILLTQSIDVNIKNYCLYQDIYGDLVLLGELINNSGVTKTNVIFTFEFVDSNGNILDYIKVPAVADYILSKGSIPFFLVYDRKENYINLEKVKIGVDYKKYSEQFKGNPVVNTENFRYTGNKLEIAGNIINIGQAEVEDLKLLAVFYNNKNQVIFIRKCFIEGEKLKPLASMNFKLTLFLDEYLPFYTHYRLFTFFRDALLA